MEDAIWYFAYGANMAPHGPAGRLIQPRRQVGARLDGYTLRFNHPGMPPLEPVFANIEPCAGGAVHGVACLITPAEAGMLDSLEIDYTRRAVRVCLQTGEQVAAYAYVSTTPCREGIPSARYLALLIAGARCYNLPASLISRWEQLHAQAPRTPTRTVFASPAWSAASRNPRPTHAHSKS
jgi:gamma-glutamylcyclotransferase (GGCT)/AIG2-like uncharacterized protein YtfP